MFNKEGSSKEREVKKELASEIFIEVPKPEPKKEKVSDRLSKLEIEDFVKSAKALSEEDLKNGESVVLKDCPVCCVDQICSNFRGSHYKPAMVGADLVYPA